MSTAETMADRLIVALDVETVDRAWDIVRQLEGTVSFFKIGFWLLLQPEANRLIDGLIGDGKKLFLDTKMYDIGETVRRGVQAAARRKISFLTVHGDTEIMKAAVDGRGDSDLKIFAVSVLTSLNDAGLRDMGYGKTVQDLIAMRVKNAAECGCDGVIASPTDNPDKLRQLANGRKLLVTTPGIRMAEDAVNDHARPGTPDRAIEDGADYLVVGRPIVQSSSPADKARAIIAAMQAGYDRRTAGK